MASKRGVRRRSQRHECGAKVPHRSKRAAEMAIANYARYSRDRAEAPRLSAYLCQWCGFWHTGHTPGLGAAALARRFAR